MRGSGQLVRLGRMRLRAEPRARGLTRPIPYGRTIRLASLADGSVVSVRGDVVEAVAAVGPNASAGTGFRVIDRDTGRVALQAPDGRFVSVAAAGAVTLVRGEPGPGETFQWEDLLTGDIGFMSLANHRYLRAQPGAPLTGNHPGPRPDHRDGSAFLWTEAK